MQIELKLILSVIKEAVKAETYIKGTIDRAAGNDQQATNGVAFHEIAGDEEVHERKIMRGIYTSADKLRSYIQDYLDVNGSNIADNNTLTIDSDNDTIDIVLAVSERFNKANSDALARLFSQYIENNTLVLWWGAINQQQMQYYASMLADNISSIQRLFIKTAPSAPTPTYTTSLSLNGSTLSLDEGESETVTYHISDGAIDDIDIISLDKGIADAYRTSEGLEIKGIRAGVCTVKVFSRHNDTLTKSIEVTVTGEW